MSYPAAQYVINKAAAKTVAGTMFNPQTSACDVMKHGRPCCSDGASKKEATKSGLPYCHDVKGKK